VEIEVEVAIEAAVEVIGLRRLRWKVEGRRNDATEAKVFSDSFSPYKILHRI